jgi:hypothetical protein
VADLAPGMHIRLQDGLPGGGSAFVEIEDDHGNSIKIGKVTRYLGGTWSIRITAEDIAKLPPPKPCDARSPGRWQWPCVHAAGHDSAHRANIPCGHFGWHDPVVVDRG